MMDVLKFVFAIFAVLAGIDRITGNHFKLGQEFEKGIQAAGTLSLAMVGMLCIAPSLANFLTPVLRPIASWLQIDPSFIGGFIANDMGGASVARELAENAMLGGYHGLIVASMMGVTICFTIPVSLKIIDEVYHREFLNGILCGIAALPVGCVVSGMVLGIPFFTLLLNLVPVLVVALVTCVGLILKPEICCKCFAGIGVLVSAIITVGLAAGVFTYLTGIELIPHMLPAREGFLIVCDIAIMLSGIFPLIKMISRCFHKAFAAAGRKMGIDEASVLGLVSSLANSIPAFHLIEKMNPKGRMMNMAFAVSASFVFGDHLAFTMAFDEAFLSAMIIGKLTSGIAAVVLVHFIHKDSGK